jgi:hypothetical protein
MSIPQFRVTGEAQLVKLELSQAEARSLKRFIDRHSEDAPLLVQRIFLMLRD